MEEEKKHIDELIATYLTEGLDKNALAELKAWIAASPENKNYFIQQREVWFSAVSREAASKYNKDKAFDTFKKRIGNRKEIVCQLFDRRRNAKLEFRWSEKAKLIWENGSETIQIPYVGLQYPIYSGRLSPTPSYE